MSLCVKVLLFTLLSDLNCIDRYIFHYDYHYEYLIIPILIFQFPFLIKNKNNLNIFRTISDLSSLLRRSGHVEQRAVASSTGTVSRPRRRGGRRRRRRCWNPISGLRLEVAIAPKPISQLTVMHLAKLVSKMGLLHWS
jgi:hypothetical protein